MSEPSRGRLGSDFGQIVDPLPQFAENVSGGVSFVPVSRVRDTGAEVLGYLWFSDAEGGADYLPRIRMTPDAFNAGVIWTRRLRAAKIAGMLPSVSVLGFAELGPDERNGQAMVNEVSSIDSLPALKELAQQ